jgi:hypothetical protein
MNYQIIKDENLLREFIEWLPELKEHEIFYVSLLARSKYSSAIKGDKAQLKRFTSRKDFLFDKIKQLECEIGSYKTCGVEIPNEALALYIHPNPRDLRKATADVIGDLGKLLYEPKFTKKPHQLVLSSIQTSCSNKLYFDLDFDNVDINETLDIVKQSINFDCFNVLKR